MQCSHGGIAKDLQFARLNLTIGPWQGPRRFREALGESTRFRRGRILMFRNVTSERQSRVSERSDSSRRERAASHPRKINTFSNTHVRQQRLVQSIPHTSPLPLTQPAPATDPRSATHFCWQLVPTDTGPEHKQDSRQDYPIRKRFAPRMSEAPWLRWWEKRLDRRPQLVVDQRHVHALLRLFITC